MKNKILFYLFLFLSFLCLFFTWVNFENKNLINVIVETKLENKDDILLKINNKYFGFKQFNNVLNQTIDKKIDSLELLINSNYKNKIESIIIFNNINSYYYQDFSDFKKDKEKLCSNELCKIYDKYHFEKKVFENQKNKFYSFVNLFKQFDKMFYLFFIFISLTIFFGCKIKINRLVLPVCLFLLMCILRLSDINSYLPWGDECYSILISQTHLPFLNLFNDPGNPPFYFFLLRIMQHFSNSIISFRLLSVVFSIFAGNFLYLFLNKNYSNKIATIALFLYSINLPLVYYSQEIRSYSLQVLLAILILICVFEILKKENNKKYWLIYGVLTIIAVNTHYFQIIFAFTNFLYLAFYFIKNKRYKCLIWLFGINFLALLAFLPYYLVTAHQKAFLDISFNVHIPNITPKLIIKNIFYIFGGLTSTCIIIIFLFKNNFSKKDFNNYYIWSIFSVTFIAIILSLIIRPMFFEHYILFLIPFVIIILSIVFSYDYKNKWIIFLFIFCVFSMQKYLKNSLCHIRMNASQSYNTFKIANEYKKKNKNTLVVIKSSDTPIKKMLKFNNINTKIVDYKTSHKISKEKIEELKKENKNLVIFTSVLDFDNNINEFDSHTCYFNSTLDLCVWKIE